MDLYKYTPIINIGLRLTIVGIKFLFNILIIKIIGTEQFGVYSIFNTSILLGTILLGFDYYLVNNRQVINNFSLKSHFISNHFYFLVTAFIICVPFFSLLFFFDFISSTLWILFFALLFTELLSNEIYRLINLFKKPLLANSILFIRSAFWILLVFLLYYLKVDIDIEKILIYWSICSAIALIIAMIILKPTSKLTLDKFSFELTKSTFWSALPFFVSTISMKLVEYSSRYFLDYYTNKSIVGVFSFYSNLSNIINIIVLSGVIVIFQPRLIEAHRDNNYLAIYSGYKKQIYIYTMSSVVLILAITFPILLLLNDSMITTNWIILPLLIAGNIFLNLSYIYNNKLYVNNKDIELRNIALFTALATILLNFILVPSYGIIGASLSPFIGNLIILIFKAYKADKIIIS